MKQFKAEPYPFQFYCNAAGDLFLPSEKGKDSISLHDMSELPYPLQDLYERFWSETHDGWLTYLVEHDGKYGLMLEQEFSSDGSDPNYTEEMALLYKEATSQGERIEKCLEKFCPKAKVFIGENSGFDDCHELCVFVPSGSPRSEIKDMLYILNLADLGKPLPATKGELYCEGYFKYMEQNHQFSTIWGISPKYAGPTFTIEFKDGAEDADTLTVCVAKSLVGEDAIPAVERCLQEVIERILNAARKVGETPELDTLVVRACNILFPGGWEFPSPALTVYIDRSGNNSHSEVCPRCGAQLMKDTEFDNGIPKIEIWCVDCGYTSVHVKGDEGFTESLHCDGYGVSTLYSKRFGTLQMYFSEQLSKEEAIALHRDRLKSHPDTEFSTLTWWNPETNHLENLEVPDLDAPTMSTEVMYQKITETHKAHARESYHAFEVAVYTDDWAREEGVPSIYTYSNFDDAFGHFERGCTQYPCVEMRGIANEGDRASTRKVTALFIGGIDDDVSDEGEAIIWPDSKEVH